MDDFDFKKVIGEIFQWLVLELIFWWPTAIFIAVLLWDIKQNLYLVEVLIDRKLCVLPIVDFAMEFFKNAMIIFAIALLVVYATRKVFPGWFFFIALPMYSIAYRETLADAYLVYQTGEPVTVYMLSSEMLPELVSIALVYIGLEHIWLNILKKYLRTEVL